MLKHIAYLLRFSQQFGGIRTADLAPGERGQVPQDRRGCLYGHSRR